jgi:hypothetical protein
MNQKQQSVLDYVSGKDEVPLYFKGESLNEKLSEISDLNSLVEGILETTINYSSYNSRTNGHQCSSNRWRSVFDIWRHVKYFMPDVSILDVMSSLHEIQSKLVGHYCDDVYRRVFRLKRGSGVLSTVSDDEFGLYFKQWKNINKE